jgi:hypothetical protein
MSTPSPAPQTTPSTPDPTAAQLWYEGIQDALIIVGACGISIPPMLQSSQVDLQIASGLAGLAGIIMSVIDRYRTARQAHASAVTSAALHVPSRVI